jgi:PAS domain-containing protein
VGSSGSLDGYHVHHGEKRPNPGRRSEPFFRQIVDASPALLYTARPDGYLDFFNQRWLDFDSVPLEKLLGWGWISCIHLDDVASDIGVSKESAFPRY